MNKDSTTLQGVLFRDSFFVFGSIAFCVGIKLNIQEFINLIVSKQKSKLK